LYTGVRALTYRRCRDGNPRGKYFNITVCSAGEVMNIQSAVAGYSASYNPVANPPQCNSNDCTKSNTHHVAAHCQGRRNCSFLQAVLDYPRDGFDALCDLQRDGNFISVDLTCVTSTVFFNIFSVVLHFRYMSYLSYHMARTYLRRSFIFRYCQILLHYITRHISILMSILLQISCRL